MKITLTEEKVYTAQDVADSLQSFLFHVGIRTNVIFTNKGVFQFENLPLLNQIVDALCEQFSTVFKATPNTYHLHSRKVIKRVGVDFYDVSIERNGVKYSKYFMAKSVAEIKYQAHHYFDGAQFPKKNIPLRQFKISQSKLHTACRIINRATIS